jgi:site-specific DNA-methyltransferase (adenine-specific)/modification methylase
MCENPWRERWVSPCGRATCYLGDNREVWPTLARPDAIVTDPPYGIGAAKAAAHSRIRDRSNWAPAFWDDAPPAVDWLTSMIDDAAVSIIWGGNYYGLPGAAGWLVWDKINPPGFSLADCEIAWSNRSGAVRMWSGLSPRQGTDEKAHPTQKPTALMSWCLEQAKVQPGQLVADPFMGSGTTGVACMRHGARFVGIEIDEGYFRTACRRIAEAARQPDLLIAETHA